MLFSLKQYLKYLKRVQLLKNIESPFVIDFITYVLKNKKEVTNYSKIKELSSFYKSNKTLIPKEDYGAGSKSKSSQNTLNTTQLLKKVSISKKNGILLHHLASYYKTKTCIELGTSLGIGTTYLSNNFNNIISIEGNKELATLSRSAIKKLDINNIEIINAKFDDVLENILKQQGNFDLLFIDGNHTEEATLAYFEIALKYLSNKSIIVFDDINWSIGMDNAWNKIIQHKEIKVSIDLFRQGIVFLDKEMDTKEHYTLWH